MLSRKSLGCFTINAMAIAVLAATVLPAQANLIIDNPGGVTPPSGSWNDGTTVTINNTNVTLNNAGSPNAVRIWDTYLRGQNVSLTVTDTAIWWSQALHLGWQYYDDSPHNTIVTVNVNNGGQLGAHTLHIGNTSPIFVGHVDVTVNITNGSELLATGDASIGGGDGVGGAGNTCVLNIESGSTFNSQGAGVVVGNTYSLSRAVVNVDGENSLWHCQSGVLTIGNPLIGGEGQVNIKNGGHIQDDGNDFHVFNGELNITTGGTLVTNLNAGLGNFSFASEPYGKVLIDGDGSSWTHNGVLTVNRGELTLSNGGKLTVHYIQDNDSDLHPTDSFYFNGGILNPTQNYIPELFAGRTPDALVLTDTDTRPGLTLEFDGTGVFTSRVFTGTGGLTKTGVGNLILTSDQEYLGLTDVKEGTLRGEASFAGSFKISDGGTYIPGAFAPYVGHTTIHIAGDYTQESGGILRMDIGDLASDTLAVGGTISLDGILQIYIQGAADEEFYVLFDNLGSAAVQGTFDQIFINDILLDITPITGMNGGGSFEFFGSTYYFSYAGDSTTGMPFGGNDVIITTLIPEPASLAILGLGAAAMLIRRRK
ncbi:MAG: PEP-CTERM sorting domain-containing protein [Phycisphaerales bacterium]|nr:PEP-CTERM sorting domain-containing protein [Phycisphaerales bacterium]